MYHGIINVYKEPGYNIMGCIARLFIHINDSLHIAKQLDAAAAGEV